MGKKGNTGRLSIRWALIRTSTARGRPRAKRRSDRPVQEFLPLLLLPSVSLLPSCLFSHVLLPLLSQTAARFRSSRRRLNHNHTANSKRPPYRVGELVPRPFLTLIDPSFIRRLKDDVPTDIYYTWQRIPSTTPAHTTHPTKLTTYQPPINTYKAISLALPASAKPSETWRLGLFAPSATGVRGSLGTLKRHVCGVWSEPIVLFGGRPRSKTEKQGSAVGKQTRVFREWAVGDTKSRVVGTETGSASDGILRIVEQTSFDLDKVSHPAHPSRADFAANASPAENLGLGLGALRMASLSPLCISTNTPLFNRHIPLASLPCDIRTHSPRSRTRRRNRPRFICARFRCTAAWSDGGIGYLCYGSWYVGSRYVGVG